MLWVVENKGVLKKEKEKKNFASVQPEHSRVFMI